MLDENSSSQLRDTTLADLGTSTRVHAVSGQPHPGYTGSFSSDVANAACGADSLSLSGDGSFVEVTNVGDLNFDTGHPFTISAWIKTDGNTTGFICGKSPATLSEPPSVGEHAFSFYVGGDMTAPHGQVNAGVFYAGELESTQTVTDGWNHVAVTYDGGTAWCLYINGVLDSTGSFGACDEGTGACPFTVGYAGNARYPAVGRGLLNTAALSGHIDEVAVWSSALSPGQIYSVFSQGYHEKSNQ